MLNNKLTFIKNNQMKKIQEDKLVNYALLTTNGFQENVSQNFIYFTSRNNNTNCKKVDSLHQLLLKIKQIQKYIIPVIEEIFDNVFEDINKDEVITNICGFMTKKQYNCVVKSLILSQRVQNTILCNQNLHKYKLLKKFAEFPLNSLIERMQTQLKVNTNRSKDYIKKKFINNYIKLFELLEDIIKPLSIDENYMDVNNCLNTTQTKYSLIETETKRTSNVINTL